MQIKIAIILLLNSIISSQALTVRNFRNVNYTSISNFSSTTITEAAVTTTTIATTTEKEIAFDEVCLTPGCAHAASKMLEKMDEQIDPCDDFYKFSCNRYIANTKIPDDRARVDVFSETSDILIDQIKTIVTSPIEESEIEPFKHIKKFYKACTNETLIEEQGLNPLIKIHEQLGGWPVVKGGSWDGTNWTWQKTIKDFKKIGFDCNDLFEFYVDNDLKNTSRRMIRLDEPDLLPGDEYLQKGLNDPVIQAYHSYQIDSAVLYGARQICAELQMKEVLEFEFALANIALAKEDRRNFNELYNPMTIKELQEKFPYNNWLEYFNSILPIESQITEDEVINVCVPEYFTKLGELLAKTPKRTIANYIFWRATESTASFLSKQITNRELEYYKTVRGTKDDEPRWQECMDWVTKAFPFATGAMYVRKFFDPKSKIIAKEMVDRIKDHFVTMLQSAKWMDESTFWSANLKAKNILTIVAYPNELLDDSELTAYYHDLKVDENDYYGSVMNIKAFEIRRDFKKLHEPNVRNDWRNSFGAAVVDAFHDMNKNAIHFPAGLFQGRFFKSDRPGYLNYGAIGTVIGHEITHGFDDQGSAFDMDGKLSNWWKNGTLEAFKKKQDCIVEQYSKFTDPISNVSLNGKITLGENMADNGGMKVAYHAYQRFVSKFGPEPRLPGLNYTQNQLFWLSGAQVWCSVYRPEEMKRKTEMSVHAPGEFRVLGALRNLKEFSKDFNCPIGSPMNPVEKCEIW